MIKYVLTAIVFFVLELASIRYVFGELGLTTLYILFIEVIIGYSIVKKAGVGSVGLMGLAGMGGNSFSVALMAAGVFIAFPGFVSDIMAVAVFIPFVRKAFFNFLKPDPQLVNKIIMNQFQKQGMNMNMFDDEFMKNASSMFGNFGGTESDDDSEYEVQQERRNKSQKKGRKNVEDAEFKEL